MVILNVTVVVHFDLLQKLHMIFIGFRGSVWIIACIEMYWRQTATVQISNQSCLVVG